MAVAALVLGICSIVFDFIFVWLGLILGVVALILGAVARKQNPGNGVATGGLVCGIIGVVLAVICWVACAACIGAIGSAW